LSPSVPLTERMKEIHGVQNFCEFQ
jgi:hypothetical protein